MSTSQLAAAGGKCTASPTTETCSATGRGADGAHGQAGRMSTVRSSTVQVAATASRATSAGDPQTLSMSEMHMVYHRGGSARETARIERLWSCLCAGTVMLLAHKVFAVAVLESSPLHSHFALIFANCCLLSMTRPQCRQKKVDAKTTCSGCRSNRGAWCGNCLWGRCGSSIGLSSIARRFSLAVMLACLSPSSGTLHIETTHAGHQV